MSHTRHSVLAVALLVTSPLMVFSQGLISQKALSADMALEIAEGAIRKCRADGFHVTVAVIDGGNGLKAFVRDDGTSVGTIDVSRRKAFTALTYRRTSAEQVKIWKSTPPPHFIQERAAAAAGGVPIRVGSEVIGAVGVSGGPSGDQEEACANAGIAKVADRLK